MPYEIMAGLERDQEVLAGYLEEGQHIIKGEARKTAIRVGVYGIPNHTMCWGKRVIDGKEPRDKIVDVEDPLYRGEIIPLKWGTQGGYPIKCRWVRGINSIDQLYQELKLKVTISDTDDNAALIQFGQGYNKYDETADKALILLLKVHYANEDSVYKSPDSESLMVSYREMKISENKTKAVQNIDSKFEAMTYINKASNDEKSIVNLYDIVKTETMSNVNRNDSADVFSSLKVYADSQPDVFIKKINDYKVGASNTIEKAKTFNLLDLTKEGDISILDNNKKEILLSNDSGKYQVDWLLENLFTEESMNAILKIKQVTDKIK